MPKKSTIKIVDVSEVLPPEEVTYNESLLSIEHDTSYPPEGELATYVGYWPVSDSVLKNIDDARFNNLSKALK